MRKLYISFVLRVRRDCANSFAYSSSDVLSGQSKSMPYSRLYPRIAHDSQVHAKISDFVRKLTYPVCAVAGHLFAQRITANTFLLLALHCNLSASTADNGFKRLNRFRAASYYFAPAACLSLCACQQLTDQPVWCAAHFNWIIYSRSVSILLRQNSLCGLSCFQKAA